MAQIESKKIESTISRRERNLDHWDVPTAAAYLGLHPETLKPLPRHASAGLPPSSSDGSGDGGGATELLDEYVGHDAAVLFYAQWCNNCHAVAPSWDAIATHVSAGSRSSKLIMALFDCEKDARHMELCVAAGVKAYPTMMFIGSGEFHDTDFVTKSVLGKDKSAGPFGATTLPRTVKFQGNWQYGDQVLDWVNIMRGLSSWHTMSDSGPLRGLRNGIFGFLTGGKGKRASSAAKLGKEGSLAVGIPPGFQSELRGMGSGTGKPSAAIDDAKVKALEQTLDMTKKEKELYEKAVTHSSNLLDGMLFPEEENSPKKGRDIFSTLTISDGWFNNATTIPSGAPNDEHPSILRACAMELSIDYCNRLTSRETNAYVELLTAIPESDPFPSLEEIETTLLDSVKSKEPYCALLESCILSDFEAAVCRPAQCPFENAAACTYLESCFDSSVQTEYGIALELLSEGEKLSEKIWDEKEEHDATTENADGVAKSTGVQGWGVPAS